tara:strand:- start:32 stop:259 length:228 start_codon:yes stop_codon:yes gene_type:complete
MQVTRAIPALEALEALVKTPTITQAASFPVPQVEVEDRVEVRGTQVMWVIRALLRQHLVYLFPAALLALEALEGM